MTVRRLGATKRIQARHRMTVRVSSGCPILSQRGNPRFLWNQNSSAAMQSIWRRNGVESQ